VVLQIMPLVPSRVRVAVASLLVCLGAVVALDSGIALALCGVIGVITLGLVCSTRAGIRFLASALVAATFATRFTIDVVGLNLRPENVLVVALLVALLACPQSPRSVRTVISRGPVLLLGAYVLWLSVVSALIPPDPLASLAIVGWLALDWLLLVVLVASFIHAGSLEDTGTKWASVTFAIATVLYFVGDSIGFGVQEAHDTVAGVKSAHGLAHEANILGSTAAIWLFIVITSPSRAEGWSRKLVVPLGSFILIVSFTRSAVVALLVGLAWWGFAEGYRARRQLMARTGVVLIVAVAALVALPSLGAPVLTKFARIAKVNEATGKARVDSVSQGMEDLELSGHGWVTGLGANSFGQRHSAFTAQGSEGYLGVLPVQLLYDGGIVGVLLLLAAFGAIRPLRLRQRARGLGLLVVFLVAALATSPFWFGSTWVLVALAVLARKRPRASPL
jgi:hypothetical protein